MFETAWGWGVKPLHWNLVNELFEGELRRRNLAGCLLGVAIFVEKKTVWIC